MVHLVITGFGGGSWTALQLFPYFQSVHMIGGSESHISGCFSAFHPKILVGDGNLRMVLCHYMNAGWVVGTPRGVGTLNPYML